VTGNQCSSLIVKGFKQFGALKCLSNLVW